MKFNEIVANEIRMLRLEKRVSIEELSKVSTLATSTISEYENNKRQISLDVLQKIVTALNSTLPIFFEKVIAKTQEKE